MPEFGSPIDADPELGPKVKMYRDTLNSGPDYILPPDPAQNRVPEVHYDENGFPVLPPDLTAITSQQLGQLFQATEAWHEYLNSMMTESDIEATVAKDIKETVKAHIKKEMRKQGVAQKECDEMYRLDIRFVHANKDYLQARNFADRLEAVKNRLSKRFTLISREITRRGDDSYVHGRGNDPDGRQERTEQRRGGQHGARLR